LDSIILSIGQTDHQQTLSANVNPDQSLQVTYTGV
jgi:hypothetical protein